MTTPTLFDLARLTRTIRAIGLIVLALFAMALPPKASAGDAGDTGNEGEVVRGSIDRMKVVGEQTRLVGWVAADGPRVPFVRVVVDGRQLPRFQPASPRFDVAAAGLANGNALGWDVTIDGKVQSSLCVSAIVDGLSYGLDCWSRNTATLLPALGGGATFGTTGRLITYSLEAEAAVGIHPETLAAEVDAVLADPRSWAGHGDARFKRVRPAVADLRIILATPTTTDRLCFPWRTGGKLSCNKGDDLIVFNSNRWQGAVPHWTASLAEYHAYLVNHEVGHTLDFRHVGCPKSGELAPLMMQQTKALGGCRPNGWPYPAGPACLGKTITMRVVAGEPLTGTAGDDVILGTELSDDISGGRGDDTICGLGGDDTLRGNAGRDEISGGPGADQLWGGKGRDRLLGNGGRDVIRGGSGKDVCQGGAGVDNKRC